MGKSLIYVKSPFQLLCAINAIRDFDIKEYSLYLIETDRIDQMISVANYFNLKYEVKSDISISIPQILLSCLRAFMGGSKKLDYFLIGDVREVVYVLEILSTHKIFKSIVYLDDGNNTIAFFSKKYNVSYKLNSLIKLIEIILYVRSIPKYFYTIYNIYSSKYIIKKNPLYISDQNKFITDISIFVGTNSEKYCKYNSLPQELYLNTIEKILNKISYNNSTQLVYIAHGRETTEEIQVICKRLNIKYVRPNNCIEMYLLENQFNVISAYGFGSTALYNIKKMYPNSVVKNIIFLGNKEDILNQYRTVFDKYNEIGIIDSYPEDYE